MGNDSNIPKPDRAENRATYESFMGATIWAIIFIITVLVGLLVVFV
jgi:hypothetical protein